MRVPNIELDKISVPATIAVTALSVGLIVALASKADATVTIALASGLTGFIGGRASKGTTGGMTGDG